MQDNLTEAMENVAAISAILHEDRERYEDIYQQHCDTLGGFVGIWEFCATAGQVFTEEAFSYIPGEDYYWIEAIDSYTDKLAGYLQAGEVPTIIDMHRLAGGAIEGNRL